jgi:hypothetical protein
MLRIVRTTLGVVFFTALAVGLAWGQGTSSRFAGVVLDQAGAAVAGANVTLTNEATKVSFTTQTAGSGAYAFDSIQVGAYTLTVEKDGFKKFLSAGNLVNVNQPVTLDVALQVGSITESVQVEASAEAVQTGSSGNFGNTVEQRTLEQLPIVGVRGRNPLTFINFQPGVQVGSNTGGGVHVHGARDRAFNFTLDGIDINESSAGGSNFTPLRTNPDSIQQFQIVTSNFTADLGRSSGAQVTLVTRSGTNEFHGKLFEFYQTPGLDANSYGNKINFRTINGQPVEQPRNQFVQHIYGGSIGGPLYLPRFGEGGPKIYNGKNKTFFFFNLQKLRSRDTVLATRTVYTQQARAGLFRFRTAAAGGTNTIGNAPAGTTNAAVDGNGNVLPSITLATYQIGSAGVIGLDPTITGLIGRTPLPNNFFFGDGLNTAGFSFAAPQIERQYDYTFKIDHNFNDRNAMYVRYAQGAQNTFGDGANGGRPSFPTNPVNIVDTFRSPKNLAVNYRWSPTNRATNEFVVGFNRFAFSFNNPDPNANNNPPFILNTVTDPLNATPPVNNRRQITTFQFVDNFSYQTGNHTFKTGFNIRYQKHEDIRSSVGGQNTNRLIFFGAPAPDAALFALPTSGSAPGNIVAVDRNLLVSTLNNLLGRMGNATQAFVAQNDNAFAPAGTPFLFDARYSEYDFYGQDTWKISSNLTLDIGLRWEPKLSPRAAEGFKILVPDRAIKLGAAPANNIRFVEGELFDDAWNNLAPSVGFAWDPFGSGKTSVRANYRLAYDRMNTFVTSSFIFPNTPGTSIGVAQQQNGALVRNGLPDLRATVTSTPGALRQPAAFSVGTLTVFDPDTKFPRTHQWGLSVQRQFKGFVAEAAYIGRRGQNLFGGYDINQANINARDPRCSDTFLQAFNAVRGGATTNCLIDLLFVGPTGTPGAGVTQFRSLFNSALGTGPATGGVGGVAAGISQLVVSGAQRIASTTASVGNPFFFQPFPQFTGALNVIDSNDISTYHGMELQLSRRMSKGLSFQASYTWAKSLDTRSFDPTFAVANRGAVQSASSTPFDKNNRRLNYARSDFDRRHLLQGYFIYELPFGRGRQFGKDLNGFVDRVIGGWELGGILGYGSGRPFTVYSGANTFSNAVQSTANCNGCTPEMGELILEGGQNFWFSAAQRALFSTPAPGQQGNTPRNFFNEPKFYQFDMTFTKRVRVTENTNFELKADVQNIMNHPAFALPSAVVGGATFGRIRDSVNNGPRRMQLALKFNF